MRRGPQDAPRDIRVPLAPSSTYARNRGCLWASLRAALADYPLLLSQVPGRAGTVDSLPFGTARVHVREGAKPGPVSGSIVITEAEIDSARKGRTVVRQGTFTGSQGVSRDQVVMRPCWTSPAEILKAAASSYDAVGHA